MRKDKLPVPEWHEPEDYLGIDWTSYNKMPEPYREIDYKEFLKILVCGGWGVAATNFRQIQLPEETGGIASVHFFLLPFNCVAVADIFEYTWSKSARDQGLKINSHGRAYHRLRFFKVGCDHKFREMSPEEAREGGGMHWGRHCHCYICDKCGTKQTVDSSG